MSSIEYDPELPFAFISVSNMKVARFAHREIAYRFGREVMVGTVVDTTPKPKIPEDAEFILWKVDGEAQMAYREDGEWYGSGEWWPGEELSLELRDAEVTVLVRKDET